MKLILKQPFLLWLKRYIRSKMLEYSNDYLQIGYMSVLNNCIFNKYNTVYENVELDEVSLGDFTYISAYTRIVKTNIGKFCSIGDNCKIGLGKHPSKTFVSTHPIFFSTFKQTQISFADKNYFKEYENITIGNDVWIGHGSIIVDGVNISDGVIVAAGAVVTKDIPPYAIVAGVPAKIIKYRFEKDKIEKLLKLQWWNDDLESLKKNYKIFHNIDDFLDFKRC